MTLTEFLATAPTDHNLVLDEARSFEVVEGRTITSDVMAMRLVGAGLYGHFTDCSVDKAHPARDICLAFMDGIRKQSEFNFIAGTSKGDANNMMVGMMINNLMTDKVAQLTALRDQLWADSGAVVKPFERVTLHDVLITRDVCPVKPVVQANGYVVLTATTDIEKHTPRLLADNPRTGERVVIGFFQGVSKAGTYDAKVPAEWLTRALFVEDAYGVI